MKLRLIFLISLILAGAVAAAIAEAKSTRPERRMINSGNKLYSDRKFKEAAADYQRALTINPGSAVATYNLALASMKQVGNLKDTTEANKKLIATATENFTKVAQMKSEQPGLAEKAFYNMGNMAFNMEQYQQAVAYYKDALRIDPNDNNARKNLRIAQLHLQKKDQNKDQNKQSKQNQDQDKKDQDKKDQKKDQNQNQNQNQDQKQPPKEENNINQQTAARILQAVDNKENQTRGRVQRASKENKQVSGRSHRKRW